MAIDLLKYMIWKNGTGGGKSYEKTVGPAPIISISDAKAKPAKSLIVGMEPIQDLHGYDSPWPAGGGENIFNPNILARLTQIYDINNDGTIMAKQADGNAWSAVPITELKAGTYTISYTANSGNARLRTSEDDYATETTVTTTCTFTLTNDGGIKTKAGVGASAYPAVIKLQVEAGSTATTWSPYSNICPISGRTGVTVTRTGVNLFDADNLVYTQCTPTDTRYANVFAQSGAYAIKAYGTGGANYIYARKKYADGSFDGIPTYIVANGNATPQIVTVNSGETLFVYDAVAHTEEESEAILKAWEIQVAYQNTQPDSYHAYTGQTYPVTWQTEAGTVYGGTVDPVSGVLTVDMAMVDLGTLTYFYVTSGDVNVFRSSIDAMPVADNSQHGITSIYPFAGTRFVANMPNLSWMIDAQGRLFIRDDRYTDISSFKTYLSGQIIVYELETPITYQLTPQQIQLLKGSNVLWSDADELTLTYLGTTPPNLLGGMLGGGLGNPQEPIEETSEEPEEEPVSEEPQE